MYSKTSFDRYFSNPVASVSPILSLIPFFPSEVFWSKFSFYLLITQYIFLSDKDKKTHKHEAIITSNKIDQNSLISSNPWSSFSS